jgi:hypothetical protein
MKIGFLEKSPGQKSMMRLSVLISNIVSGVVSIWGMLLITKTVNAIINGDIDDASIIGSVALIVMGALGLVAGSQGIKAVQQRGEIKENNGHG